MSNSLNNPNGPSIFDAASGGGGGALGTSGFNAAARAANGLVQVGQRCGWQTIGPLGASQPFSSFHQRMVFPNGADAIQLIYGNYEVAGSAATHTTEIPGKVSMFRATSVVYTGGTLYAVGDIDTFTVSTSTGIVAVRVLITAVAAGVPTAVQILDGGLYVAPLASGVSPASTTGTGTGATAIFTWQGGYAGMHVAIEPLWNTLVASGSGLNAIAPLSAGGVYADQTIANSLFIPIDGFLMSDIMRVDIPIGGVIGIRTSMGFNFPTKKRPLIDATTSPSIAPTANYEAHNGGTTFTDLSLSGSFGANVDHQIFTPALVLGIPKQQSPSVISLGDSRVAGCATGTGSYLLQSGYTNYDTVDVDGNCGWFEKALSNTVGLAIWPWAQFGMPADDLQYALASSSRGIYQRLKMIGMAKPTAVYLGLNVNDLNTGGQTTATVKAWEDEIIQMIRGMGVKYVFTDTTDPVTTSSDSFATVVNQTLATASPNIAARNAALRAKTWANYDFFIDNSPIVESSVGSGKWNATGVANAVTGDGLHASPALNTQKAANAGAVIAANISL